MQCREQGHSNSSFQVAALTPEFTVYLALGLLFLDFFFSPMT